MTREGTQCRLTDLDSSHGTFVNGVPVKERLLQHGDRIAISDSLFLFVAGPARVAPESGPLPLGEKELVARTASQLRLEDALYLQPDKVLATLAPSARLAKDLNALLKVSTSIHALQDPVAIQERLLELALEAVPADHAACLILGDRPEEFGTILARDRSGALESPSISRAIALQTVRERTAIMSHDLLERGASRVMDGVNDTKVCAVLCVPLATHNRVEGALYLDTTDLEVRFDDDHLQLLTAMAGLAAVALENVRQLDWLRSETRRLQADANAVARMVGESPQIREVQEFITKVARTDATVLIRGETGTGKELVARAIHACSPRSGRPFMAIACSALSETLLESELFGHEKGAFTGAIAQRKGRFESADGGTVFLDEIGEIAPVLQVKLLRVLQEREFERVGGTRPLKVDIRLVAATNRDLEEAVGRGAFREDLYYRLNVVSFKMPPLRARRDDVPLLARHFIAKYATRLERRFIGLSSDARSYLMAYDWPGNVRELENIIERAVVLGSSDVIQPEDLPEVVLEAASPKTAPASAYHRAIRETKKQVALKALAQAKGNFTDAARSLGVHPNHLHRLVRNLKLKMPSKS